MAAFAPAVPVADEDDALEEDEVEDEEVVVISLVGVVVAAAGVDATAGVVAPPMGAVDAPSICAWTAGEKVPVIPVMVNFAEKDNAGAVGVVGSIRLRD